eukprot:TRINITY_DN962_c0_g2_i4.p1 TRINITY_DN962_c0_g2~~TRINITY_DN962_c0_g2_i4.p1  ORF type:complete len:902 (+),score=119.52 TRINITY_DN962_c0_g2_i4:120-2825(+)
MAVQSIKITIITIMLIIIHPNPTSGTTCTWQNSDVSVAGCTKILGDVQIDTQTELSNSQMQLVERISGNLTISGYMNNMSKFANLEVVEGSLYVGNLSGSDVLTLGFNVLKIVGGSLDFTCLGSNIGYLELYELADIGENLVFKGSPFLRTVSLPKLRNVNGTIDMNNNILLESFILDIEYIGGNLLLEMSSNLQTIILPKLVDVGGSLVLNNMNYLQFIHSSVEYISGGIYLTDCVSLSNATFPNLKAEVEVLMHQLQNLSFVDFGIMETVQFISMYNSTHSNANFSSLVSCVDFFMFGTGIKHLNLNKLQSCEKLLLYSNFYLENLELSNLDNALEIHLHNNLVLKSVYLDYLQTLGNINLLGSGLEQLALPKLRILVSLHLSDKTQLRNISMPVLESANTLSFVDTISLEILQIPRLENITIFRMENCTSIFDIDLSALSYIHELTIGFLGIDYNPFTALVNTSTIHRVCIPDCTDTCPRNIGFENTTGKCQVINPCEVLNGECDHICVHSGPGTRNCYCNNLDFQIINETHCRSASCNIDNGDCEQVCVSSHPIVCGCNDGYILSEKSCLYDICLDENGGCEHHCKYDQNISDWVCSCNEGFVPSNDTHCMIENICNVNNGGCDGNCEYIGYMQRKCSCDEGFVLINETQCMKTCQVLSSDMNCSGIEEIIIDGKEVVYPGIVIVEVILVVKNSSVTIEGDLFLNQSSISLDNSVLSIDQDLTLSSGSEITIGEGSKIEVNGCLYVVPGSKINIITPETVVDDQEVVYITFNCSKYIDQNAFGVSASSCKSETKITGSSMSVIFHCENSNMQPWVIAFIIVAIILVVIGGVVAYRSMYKKNKELGKFIKNSSKNESNNQKIEMKMKELNDGITDVENDMNNLENMIEETKRGSFLPE